MKDSFLYCWFAVKTAIHLRDRGFITLVVRNEIGSYSVLVLEKYPEGRNG